ncbi:hypothetical protein HOS47_gp38 [Pseudomonas phage uligo]|uniref:Uncharacterized protein n=1 Tax=Pseudomonas phage uligo TaxID=2048979 RepID=A0A2H4P7P9_9CAUD|nr:hypothetical protein HOS47_gp38 [Pseudomonas phage uligo]ATW58197.1 hypothetical protein [Pseudomonas phage uligo]
MGKRDGHYELAYVDRPYDSGFRSVRIETEPEAYEWERVPMFDGRLWFAIFQRPTKVCIRNSLDNGFTMTTKIFNNTHIAQAVFNIDGNEYLPRHNKLKCYVTPEERDFRGYKMSFTLNMTPGAYRNANLPFGTTITLTDANGKEWYVRLWNYTNEETSTPDKLDVTIDFDNLYTGFSDIDDFREKVPVDNLVRLSLNVVDKDYYAIGGYDAEDIAIEDLPELPIKLPSLADVVVSNISCTRKSDGAVKTHARGKPMNADGSPYQTDLGIATSFDDIANTSPRRVVEDMYRLGYRGVINHYMGISNYPRLVFKEDTQQFQLDSETCLDEVVKLWHEDFLQQCIRMDFQCILAVSMEVFYGYVRYNYRHWMQLCQGFQVLEVDDEYIKIEGSHPWTSVENPFLGGFEHQGLFNPNKPEAAEIRFAHPEDNGVETSYKVLWAQPVENEDKTLFRLDKRFRGWYGDYSVGKPALTGYNPPSTFFNTRIEEEAGATYVARCFKELADIVPEGMAKMFQVGEPWYWDGSYQNGRLFAYDKPTVEAALRDGVEIPVWENIRSFSKQRASAQEIAAANWLRDSLGVYTQKAKIETLAAHPDAQFSCLTFIPQIFTTNSEITPIINFPFQHWSYPNFEFFQYEAYDSIIWGDLEFTNVYCDYAFDKLGYPVEKTNYLGGFAPNKDPTGQVWRNIAHQLSWPNTKLDQSYQPMQSLIWASTQVNRDSVMFSNDGGKLPADKPIWNLSLELVSDWAEYSRQDRFWLPSEYGITEGVTFTQRKTKNESRITQWYLVNPANPEERVLHGNPITTRRSVVLETRQAVGRKNSQEYYPFADCILNKESSAVFDYNKDTLDDLEESSIDWGDGSAKSEGLEPNLGDYADSGSETYPAYSTEKMCIAFAGQSQAAIHFLYGEYPDRGVDEFSRKLVELVGVSPARLEVINGATGSSAADRASAVNPNSPIFDPEQTSGAGGLWWWDLEADAPGPCLDHCMAQLVGKEVTSIMWSQGDQDAIAVEFPDTRNPKPTIARSKAATLKVFEYFRQKFGPQLQIFIQEQGWSWTEQMPQSAPTTPMYVTMKSVAGVSGGQTTTFNWLSYRTAPTGLTFVLDILNVTGTGAIIRTLPMEGIVGGLMQATYTEAQQIADFGFPPGFLAYKVRCTSTGTASPMEAGFIVLNAPAQKYPFNPAALPTPGMTDFAQPVAFGNKSNIRDMQAELIAEHDYVHMGAVTKQYGWELYRLEPGLGYIHFSQDTARLIGAALAQGYQTAYGSFPHVPVTIDANRHTYNSPGAFQPKVQPSEAAQYVSIWFRDGGVQTVDFGMFPIAKILNFSHNDMTTAQMDELIDRLMYFSDERAREAYRTRSDLHLYIGQQSTDEHATPEKIKDLVRYFDNLGVKMVVHS